MSHKRIQLSDSWTKHWLKLNSKTFYLDTEIDVIHLVMQNGDRFALFSGVIQLTFVFSFAQRPKIYGHTVGLNKTQHPAALLIRYLFHFDHVAPHFSVCYWFLKYDHATFIICRKQTCSCQLRDGNCKSHLYSSCLYMFRLLLLILGF